MAYHGEDRKAEGDGPALSKGSKILDHSNHGRRNFGKGRRATDYVRGFDTAINMPPYISTNVYFFKATTPVFR